MRNLFYLLVFLGSLAFGQDKNLIYTYENSKSLGKFLDANKVNYDIKDLAVLQGPKDWLDFYKARRLSVPTAFFFNSEGMRIIENFGADTCPEIINGIETPEKIKAYKAESQVSLNEWLGHVDFAFTNEEIFTQAYDLYVIIIYGKCIRTSTSNDVAFKWYNSVKKNSKVKIKTILLSIDLMDSWEIPQDFKDEFGFP